MLRVYLLQAIRHLGRRPWFTVLHVTGLILAGAVCILALGLIRFETSFDAFHTNGDRIVRVDTRGLYDQDAPTTTSWLSRLVPVDHDRSAITTPFIGPDLVRQLPEVEGYVRMYTDWQQSVQTAAGTFKQKEILIADACFFQMLTFPLLTGNPQTALDQPTKVVLSRSTAVKYFGNAETALGKTVRIMFWGEYHPFLVSGVAQDAPAGSSLTFSMVLPFSIPYTIASGDRSRNLGAGSNYTLLLLRRGTSVTAFREKLSRFSQTFYRKELAVYNASSGEAPRQFALTCTPLAQTHLDSIEADAWPRMGQRLTLYVFSFIALFLLMIACVNYVSFALAMATQRFTEIGLRKTLGAGKIHIMLHILLEALVTMSVGAAGGIVLANMLLPVMNGWLEIPIPSHLLFTPWVFPLVLFMTALTGIYPAMLLARYTPAMLQRRIHSGLSSTLITFQNAACFTLLLLVLVMQQQLRYVRHTSLGFDKDNVLVIDEWGSEVPGGKKAVQLAQRFSDLALNHPGILGVSRGTELAGRNGADKMSVDGHDEKVGVVSGDFQYASVMGLRLLYGRALSASYPEDSARAGYSVVINETLARIMGSSLVLNQPIPAWKNVRVVGIVRDFHTGSLLEPIRPTMIRYQNNMPGYMLIRIRPDDLPATLSLIKKSWKDWTGGLPLTYSFLNEDLAQAYIAQARWMDITGWAAIIAILVTGLGLFGLAGLKAANRTREIGIRKVLGASVGEIVRLLSADFIRYMLIAFVVSLPVAWWCAHLWLQNFAYRVSPSAWLFGLTALSSAAVVLLSVGSQAFRAARANPIESLRTE